MSVVRYMAWGLFIVIAGLATALGVFFWIEQPLWVDEYTGAKNSFAITADGQTLISFVRTADGPEGKSGHRVFRRQARNGRLIGTSFIAVDPAQIEHSAAQLIGDNLVWLVTEQHGMLGASCSIYEVVNGNRVFGPISGREIDKAGVDPHGRCRVRMPPERDRVEVVSLTEGKVLFEVSRPQHFVQGAMVHRDGERLLVCWKSGGANLFESWDFAQQQRQKEANVMRFALPPRGLLIADRLHFYTFDRKHISISLGDDDFGAERAETVRDEALGLIDLVRPVPDYIVATRNAKLADWQEIVNQWLKKVGFPGFVRRSEFAVVVLDDRTGVKIGEMPQTGTGYALSANGNLLAAYDTSGRIVVWDVRRTPERGAIASATLAAIGVLLLALWRNRRSRIAAIS